MTAAHGTPPDSALASLASSAVSLPESKTLPRDFSALAIFLKFEEALYDYE